MGKATQKMKKKKKVNFVESCKNEIFVSRQAEESLTS